MSFEENLNNRVKRMFYKLTYSQNWLIIFYKTDHSLTVHQPLLPISQFVEHSPKNLQLFDWAEFGEVTLKFILSLISGFDYLSGTLIWTSTADLCTIGANPSLPIEL